MMDTEEFEPDIFFFDSPSQKVETNKKKKKKKKAKNKKVEFEKTMESCPKSPYKCKNHPSDSLRLKKATKNPPNCKSCGIKLDGQKGYLACPKSSGCYSICSVCRVCPQNHILIHCASLRQYDGELYNKNRFKCDCCGEEKEVGNDGVLHCNPCNCSICMVCI